MKNEYAIKEWSHGDEPLLRRCFPLFQVLRPHLSEEAFMRQVPLQAQNGYRLIYVERDGAVVAGAGFRTATFLAWGRVLYIDDLITAPAQRGTGLGGALLDWLLAEGRRLGCGQMHLDTGYQRHDAHRLYLNRGFVLSSHHMSVALT